MLEVTTIGSHAGSQGFIFYQDGTPAQMMRIMQGWLQSNCLGLLKRIIGPQTLHSLDLNPLHWGAMLEKYHKLQLKPKM